MNIHFRRLQAPLYGQSIKGIRWLDHLGSAHSAAAFIGHIYPLSNVNHIPHKASSTFLSSPSILASGLVPKPVRRMGMWRYIFILQRLFL